MPEIHRLTGVSQCLVAVILGALGTAVHAQPSAASATATSTATSRITLTIPERVDRDAIASLEHCGEIQARRDADGRTTRVEIQCREAPATARRVEPEPGLISEVLVAPI